VAINIVAIDRNSCSDYVGIKLHEVHHLILIIFLNDKYEEVDFGQRRSYIIHKRN
jgi:hypothetical protein